MKYRLIIAGLTVFFTLRCAAQLYIPLDQVRSAKTANWPPAPMPTPAPAQSPEPEAAQPAAEDKSVRHVAVELTDGSVLFGTMPADTSFQLRAENTDLKIAMDRIDAITFPENGKKEAIDMQNGDRVEGLPGINSLTFDTLIGKLTLELGKIKSVSVRTIGLAELVFRDPSGNGRAEFLNAPRSIHDRESIATKKIYKPPVEITIVAKTDSTNLRIWYTVGAIFNWELNPNQLQFDRGDGQSRGNGGIPINKYVTVRWVVTPHGQKIYADGQLRYEDDKDYSQIESPVVVYQHSNSTVTVKSIEVKALPAE